MEREHNETITREKKLRIAIRLAMGRIGMNEDDDSIQAYDILKKALAMK